MSAPAWASPTSGHGGRLGRARSAGATNAGRVGKARQADCATPRQDPDSACSKGRKLALAPLREVGESGQLPVRVTGVGHQLRQARRERPYDAQQVALAEAQAQRDATKVIGRAE